MRNINTNKCAIHNGKLTMAYLSARNLHKELFNSRYFISKFLQHCPLNAWQVKINDLLLLYCTCYCVYCTVLLLLSARWLLILLSDA